MYYYVYPKSIAPESNPAVVASQAAPAPVPLPVQGAQASQGGYIFPTVVVATDVKQRIGELARTIGKPGIGGRIRVDVSSLPPDLRDRVLAATPPGLRGGGKCVQILYEWLYICMG